MKKKYLLFFSLLILFSIFFAASCNSKKVSTAHVSPDEFSVKETSTTQTDIPSESSEAPPLPTLPNYTDVNIMMVGDMLMHEEVYDTGLYPDGTYNFDHLFKNILPDIQSSDVSIVNQETILGGTELGLSAYPSFNSPYEVGDSIAKAGFNVVLQATNHTLDKGLKGVENCLNFWSTKHPDMNVLGINETEEESRHIYIYQKNDFKIAILNYTYGTNGIPIPPSKPYLLNMLEKNKIAEDVAKARELADFVIICPHWGTEYVFESSTDQEKWAQYFLDLGVDLVIGTHPHVIEPVQMLEREDGHKMLVYYSLGNFVSNQTRSYLMIGAMAKITLRKDDSGAYIKDYGVEPLVTHRLPGIANTTTYKLSQYTDDLASSNLITQDEEGADFSLEYCKNLCHKVFGDLYKGN